MTVAFYPVRVVCLRRNRGERAFALPVSDAEISMVVVTVANQEYLVPRHGYNTTRVPSSVFCVALSNFYLIFLI